MLLRGDARQIPLADATVQCIMTSPPYWGLRDYGLNGVGIGLEPKLDGYIENMRAVGRELWRVLRDDGTLWLNMGDCYWSDTLSSLNGLTEPRAAMKKALPAYTIGKTRPSGLKPKDLIGLPWRVAFALQADGWYLRSDIIWAKPNPMPESVTDRPTKSHEYLFLLAKSQRYYYDADAVREGSTERNSGNIQRKMPEDRGRPPDHLGASVPYTANGTGRNRRTVWTADSVDEVLADIEEHRRIFDADEFKAWVRARLITMPSSRGDVWKIATQPYRGAHFATFPEKLVEPCILAGTKPGDLVFDPFCGSGTVGAVSRRLGRRFVGLDLSADYLDMARKRIGAVSLGMGL